MTLNKTRIVSSVSSVLPTRNSSDRAMTVAVFTGSSIDGVFANQVSVAAHVVEDDLKESVEFKIGSHVGITQSDRII